MIVPSVVFYIVLTPTTCICCSPLSRVEKSSYSLHNGYGNYKLLGPNDLLVLGLYNVDDQSSHDVSVSARLYSTCPPAQTTAKYNSAKSCGGIEFGNCTTHGVCLCNDGYLGTSCDVDRLKNVVEVYNIVGDGKRFVSRAHFSFQIESLF